MKILVFFSSLFKGLILLLRPHYLFGFIIKPLQFIINTLLLSRWKSSLLSDSQALDDFYSFKRDYNKRYLLYEHLIKKYKLNEAELTYMEFGVASGSSFDWWLKNIINYNAHFFGFDTFEGLPEDWGAFDKGSMAYDLPKISDKRASFVKGLFQDTLNNFIVANHEQLKKRLIIHLDADLFSATLFTLFSLKPFLKKGDILMFDEFNVPNHEFYAFRIFCDSAYIKVKLVAAVNNYYQTAFIVQ